MPPASPYISQSSIEYHVQTPGQIFPESGNGIFNIDPNPSQHYFQISQEIFQRPPKGDKSEGLLINLRDGQVFYRYFNIFLYKKC